MCFVFYVIHGGENVGRAHKILFNNAIIVYKTVCYSSSKQLGSLFFFLWYMCSLDVKKHKPLLDVSIDRYVRNKGS